ncbi:MAG TPA: hypothetical protein VGH90_05000 [Chthoniobacteraceae bacterium]|jgi:hypothetical protein
MEIVKKTFRACAPSIERIEKTTVEMIGDRHRQDRAAAQASSESIRTERLQIFGNPAILVNDSTVLLWRKGVPKELLHDTDSFPDWSTTEWAYFVASVKMSAPAPSFRVRSVHGEMDSAIQELVTEATGLPLAA